MVHAPSSGCSGITRPTPCTIEEGILTADLDLDQITQARYDFDVIGHYNRPDVFQLTADESPAVGFKSVLGADVIPQEKA